MISESRPLLRADVRYRKRSIECKFGLALSPTIPCWSLCLHSSGCDSVHICLALFPTSGVGMLSIDSTFVQCHSLSCLRRNLGNINSFYHHCDKAHWQKQCRNLFWFFIHKGQSNMPGEPWWMEVLESVVAGGWGCWFYHTDFHQAELVVKRVCLENPKSLLPSFSSEALPLNSKDSQITPPAADQISKYTRLPVAFFF